MCKCFAVHHTWCLPMQEEGSRSPGTWLTVGCMLLHSSGNWIWILCKTSVCFQQLSHLSLPYVYKQALLICWRLARGFAVPSTLPFASLSQKENSGWDQVNGRAQVVSSVIDNCSEVLVHPFLYFLVTRTNPDLYKRGLDKQLGNIGVIVSLSTTKWFMFIHMQNALDPEVWPYNSSSSPQSLHLNLGLR